MLDQPWDPTPRHEIESREDRTVNNNAQYCSVARTGIGHTKLVIGGEVDACMFSSPHDLRIPSANIPPVWDCKPDRKEDPINWVELKTSAEIRNDRDMFKYERKLLKFWAQSFLLGVPKIIVGFRDQHGILRRLEEVETASIPSKVKKVGRNTWDGNICINFTDAFLECMYTGETLLHEAGANLRKQVSSPQSAKGERGESASQRNPHSLSSTRSRRAAPAIFFLHPFWNGGHWPTQLPNHDFTNPLCSH